MQARLIMGMTTADKDNLQGDGASEKDRPLVFHSHGGKLLESLAGFQAILFKPIMNSIIARCSSPSISQHPLATNHEQHYCTVIVFFCVLKS
jgi:hypothetical protein